MKETKPKCLLPKDKANSASFCWFYLSTPVVGADNGFEYTIMQSCTDALTREKCPREQGGENMALEHRPHSSLAVVGLHQSEG